MQLAFCPIKLQQTCLLNLMHYRGISFGCTRVYKSTCPQSKLFTYRCNPCGILCFVETTITNFIPTLDNNYHWWALLLWHGLQCIFYGLSWMQWTHLLVREFVFVLFGPGSALLDVIEHRPTWRQSECSNTLLILQPRVVLQLKSRSHVLPPLFSGV